jgi:hypothetical protein
MFYLPDEGCYDTGRARVRKGWTMAQTQWIRLNHEQADRVLGQLSGRKDAVVFSRDVTEVAWRGLAFYNNYRLCRLVNYATMPVFSMVYLTNGEDYIQLDGTANPIYTADEKDPLILSEENVVAYLEFFFSNVQGSEGDVFLVRDPHKLPFMSTLSAEQRQSIIDSFRPVSVSFVDNAYKVSATLHYGGALLAATIVVATDGKISFEQQTMLLNGIHFPDTPYTQAWAEG